MVFKITEELLEKARATSQLGVDRAFLDDLYRKENLSMRLIAERLRETKDSEITVKDVNALFYLHNIPSKTRAEVRDTNKAISYSEEKIQDRISLLSSLGFDKQKLTSMYVDAAMSKNAIIDEINLHSKKNVVNKIWLNIVFDHYKIEQRTSEEINQNRMQAVNRTLDKKRDTNEMKFGAGYTAPEIVALYNSEEQPSLEEIYRTTGVSPQTAKKMIVKAGGTVRIQQSHGKLLKDLKKAGFDESDVRQRYQDENRFASEVRDWVSDVIGYEAGTKAFDTFLRKHDIKKTPEQIKHLRGEKSRAEKEESFKKLQKAGFDTPQDLADYFDKNKNITYHALVRKLNATISGDDTPFTNRWLERHMVPLLSEDRLRGTSRIEKEFILELAGITDSPITENTRSFIAPYELDALLPELNIAFEFNGDYWHSDKFLERNHGLSSVEYHVRKRQLCADKGVKLFFVWESDWINRQDDVVLAMIDVIVDPSLNPDILCRLEPTDAENDVELDEDDFVSEAV